MIIIFAFLMKLKDDDDDDDAKKIIVQVSVYLCVLRY